MGMGEDLYREFTIVKDIYHRAAEILEFDVMKLSFHGPEEELKQTRITQPAIFVHSMVVVKLLEEKNIKPTMTAGHSLGEYSALVAAGALEFEDALQLVKLRGELMQRAGEENPGTMAAIIGLGPQKVVEICRQAQVVGVVQPANFNSPAQIAISGSIPAVKKAMNIAQKMGAKRAIELVVSGAFHSPLMESAREGLKKELDVVEIRDATIPVYANVTAKPVTHSAEIKKLLYQQLTSPVRWSESMQNMIRDGANRFVEVGPGTILAGLLKRIDRHVECNSVGDLKSLEEVTASGSSMRSQCQ